ncbi:MAG: ABC transporter permease [Pseudomonadota bacterium]
MTLVARLALRDLLFHRVQLLCMVAVLSGVLVPLLVLFGVKNGVYDALIGDLLANPRNLQIDTSGNALFTTDDADLVRGWPESGFVTLKTRSQFDFVNVRLEGGREKRDAILIASGAGDPNLPDQLDLPDGAAVVSAQLAAQLGITTGDRIDVITQAEDRPRQMRLPLDVVAVLPQSAVQGRAILTGIGTLDLVEAFYDAYALPEHGIVDGKPMSERRAEFEGLRAYAARLEHLAPLQTRIETEFGINTEARTAQVESVLQLGRNLNRALLLTAGVASVGLAAALVFGFWAEVQRKRQVLAVLSLMGLAGGRLWVFPLVQSAVTAVLALIVSFLLLAGAAQIAEQLFSESGADAGVMRLSAGQIASISLFVLAFVMASALFAARAALHADPATVLREAVL